MGACPDWYPLVAAARWLGVPPWELERAPAYWRDRALAAASAEAHAMEMKQKHAR